MVYIVKHKLYGIIERYKTKLVGKWYNQVERLVVFDTFSPVVKITIVRNLIALTSIDSRHLPIGCDQCIF